MTKEIYGALQFREIFHLEFLRQLARRMKQGQYVLKGGVNLRLFFRSFRYSEDMDLDISGPGVDGLKETVMRILQSPSFRETLAPFGIEGIVPPDVARAKQTLTNQRFKIHLVTRAGEDLFTKVEFSRRGFSGRAIVQAVPDIILREYKLPPLLVSHYGVRSAVKQKVAAVAGWPAVQARDVFDLYILSPQWKSSPEENNGLSESELTKARQNIFAVGFEQFRDTVIPYLSFEEQSVYDRASAWDEVRLKADNFLQELKAEHV